MSDIDIYRAYNFKLEIQGITAGHFTEVSGLGVKVQAIEFREGGAGPAVRKLAGRVEYGDVTLCYGLTESVALWEWLMAVVSGRVEPKNATIHVMAPDGMETKMSWNLSNAWPSEWRGARFDAMGNEAAIECVRLSHEGIQRA